MVESTDIPVTSAPLLAAARHFGQHCKGVSDEFMICRFDKKDPEKCAELGKKVTQCGIELYVAVFPPTDSDVRFKKMAENCNTEFTQHWVCLDNNNQDYWRCRTTQQAYDKCALEKMGLDGDYTRFLPKE